MSDKNSIDAEDLLKRIGFQNQLGNWTFSAASFEYLNPSYSLTGEDLFLRKRLRQKLLSREPGKYVDIGSFHPFLGSNTYLFYVYGWSGVCVDANPIFTDMYGAYRPRDTFLNKAVSQTPRDFYFAQHQENTGMSRVFDSAEEVPAGFAAPIKVPCERLDTVLDASFASGDVIDLMSVDVEGMDVDVLKSNDWSRFRPQVLCVEEHELSVDHPKESDVVGYMQDVGYQLIAVTPPNVFFEDSDHHPIP